MTEWEEFRKHINNPDTVWLQFIGIDFGQLLYYMTDRSQSLWLSVEPNDISKISVDISDWKTLLYIEKQCKITAATLQNDKGAVVADYSLKEK